ncbi:MAG: DUF4157 domain-containing protein, partial [Acidobacteriota bacterium]
MKTHARRPSASPEGFRSAPQRAEVRQALRVGSPDDEHEREADRVAAEVVRGGATEVSLPAPPGELRRSPAAGPAGPAQAPRSVHETLASPGRPLERPLRERLESRFGADFGGVRVHADSQADASARAVSARAYT